MKGIILGIIPTILIILLLVYLIKLIMNKIGFFKERKILKVTAIFFSTISIYLVIAYVTFSYISNGPDIDFDKKLWMENREIQYQMVDDLVESNILVGKTEYIVKGIIGEPTQISVEKNKWRYEITGRTWSEFTLITLELNFENGKVISASLNVKKI